MKRNNILSALLISAILFLTPLSACGSVNSDYGYDYSAVDKLQKQVPFTIVLPTYLPENMRNIPPLFDGPIRGYSSPQYPESVLIRARFTIGTNLLIIEEENAPIEGGVSETTTTLIFAGVRVLEDSYENSIFGSSGSTLIRGFAYYWTSNNVSYSSVVCGYPKDECRKVIESMIK